ncbi:uncharacterized protein LOC124189670 isoform X1 [Daphnia pulex]|uniref:uncharacterized protein LOC124189670 isoform X1 n=2 Tax=Daphnia pulex TaxID=6669 RepID=UPI001EDCE99F|nr:uncharacterized protein LOC124189670 isoform X1 [Daphnia pulex]XP_046438050.1 uncharacterized protein LOC124189670 isoform X1 [Daphnia pulex]XP_046438051.1 uncharacterized protein LOC124189670 isoform X1 [Daphnia pulex]
MSSTNMIISLVSVSTVVIFAGLFASWCVRTIRTLIKSPSKSELKLQGLPVQPTRKDGQPESMRFQRRIQSTMAAFIENGMDDELAPLVVSRLEWCNQINRYLDMLKNTPESIESVANGIEVLMNYHQLHRSEAEQDLVDAIFSRALKNGSISHLYAKLLKRLRSGDQKGWTQNIVRLLFQFAVEEFNRPLDSDDENSKSRVEKFNNVKLMAAIFKREMPGVPDGWITDCAETLIYRLETGVTEESVKQLCLFLTTLLIAEPGENCDSITPTRQRQLLTCFEALERAATPPKVPQQPDVKIQKSDATTQTLKPESDESDTDTSTDESDTEEYEAGPDSETNGLLEPAEIRTNSASASDNRMN